MALPSTQRFTNAISGLPLVGTDVNIYATNANPAYPLGQKYIRGDGNEYAYCSFDAATTAGRLVAPTAANMGKTITTTGVLAPGSAVAVQSEYPILPGQVGSHHIQITLSSITLNQFQGGYFAIVAGSGLNFIYRIKGNTATGNPASGTIDIQLYEPIQVLISANTTFIIAPCLYNDVTVASAATNWMVAGVTCSTTTATNLFGWICIKGVTQCLEDDGVATVVGGDTVGLSRSTNGAYVVYGGGGTTVVQLVGEQPIGYCVQPNGTNGGLGVIKLGFA